MIIHGRWPLGTDAKVAHSLTCVGQTHEAGQVGPHKGGGQGTPGACCHALMNAQCGMSSDGNLIFNCSQLI